MLHPCCSDGKKNLVAHDELEAFVLLLVLLLPPARLRAPVRLFVRSASSAFRALISTCLAVAPEMLSFIVKNYGMRRLGPY